MRGGMGAARHWLEAFIEFRRLAGLIALPRYFANWSRYSRLGGAIDWRESYPILTDWVAHTPFDAHYFYQAAWVGRKLANAKPLWHLDVGSSVMMINVLSAIIPTVFLDYRPLCASLPGLTPVAGDVLALPIAPGTVQSLSCLHVIEHIGLGRYGDALDPEGSRKAASELVRILASGGHLYLSTPIGRERVQFNAHRVFAPETVLAMFRDLEYVDGAVVDDRGNFCTALDFARANHFEYGCGMYEFRKL